MPESLSAPPSVPALVTGDAPAWETFVARLNANLAKGASQLLATHFTESLARLALDAELKALLPAMGPGLTALLKENPRLLADSGDWLRPLLTRLLISGMGWYPGSKESRDFSQAFSHFLEELPKGVAASSALLQLLDKQEDRARLLETRCRDSELGMVKIQRAQTQVQELLNQLVDLLLPESLCDFLRKTLKGELQFVLINQDEKASAWQSWSVIVQRLSSVFPARNAADEPLNRQQLYRDVQVLVGLLDEHVTVSASQQEAYDQGVEELRERLFERLRGHDTPLVPFAPLVVEDELSRSGVSLSPAVSKQASGLKAGQWFLFSPEEDQWLRCKLLLCPPDYVSLLFVNRQGQRVLQKTPQEFSACLATGLARPLAVEGVYEWLLSQTLEPLLKQLTEVVPVEVETKPATGPDLVPVAETVVADEPGVPEVETSPEPSASPAVNRKSAADKALQEARVLAKLQQRRDHRRVPEPGVPEPGVPQPETPEQVFALPETEEARLAQASDWVEELNIGALLNLTLAGVVQRCKLVAIMRANEFYIFTDRQGVKVAELERASLVDLLARGAAQIHTRGDNFEGQLSKVVKTLRREH